MKKKIVVKIGSSLLTNADGQIALEKIHGHVEAIAKVKKKGHDIVLVTSGSIAAGYEKLGFPMRPKGLVQKQACAAVGQSLLMQHYNEYFARHGYTVAQILLTKTDFSVRESYNNALNTLDLLLSHNAVPIINQNDTTATDEISFGDNDALAARVATLLHADLCIIFTDIDGLYDANPNLNKDAKQIPVVERITPEIIKMTGDSISGVGTGGMRSKIIAAELSTSMGVPLFVADGRDFNDSERILKILAGQGAGTYFKATQQEMLQRKKQWIAIHSKVQGTLIIDDGAVEALINGGHSLLPVGVKAVLGSFEKNSVVEIRNNQLGLVGRGIARFSAQELLVIITNKTDKRKHQEEIIHRDDFVGNELHSM